MSQVPCTIPGSIVGTKDTMFNPYYKSNLGDLVNIESHLKRMDLHDSKCIQGRTLDDMNMVGDHLKNKLKSSDNKCNIMLQSSHSRMENPTLNVKSMTMSRFDFPLEDPRGQVYYGMGGIQSGDMRFGTDSRHESRNMGTALYLEHVNKKFEFQNV